MRRKCLFLFLMFSMFVLAFWLGAWTAWVEKYAHYTPEYAKVDIVPILQKEELVAADYEELFQQTGMARAAVEELRAEGRQSDLLYLQERFFAEVELECLRDNLIVQSERLMGTVCDAGGDGEVLAAHTDVGDLFSNAGGGVNHSGTGGVAARATMRAVEAQVFLPAVQTGDILISFNGHVFGWRNGHAAIVVDAEEGLTLEAITLGSESRICEIEKWAEYPCFALLRLEGASQEERSQIAEYAEQNLLGVSYRLLAFSGNSDSLTGTHCAHLVWSAYAKFGYDLDSDGGLIVTPRDIFDSDLLEVVQIYGLDPRWVAAE